MIAASVDFDGTSSLREANKALNSFKGLCFLRIKSAEALYLRNRPLKQHLHQSLMFLKKVRAQLRKAYIPWHKGA